MPNNFVYMSLHFILPKCEYEHRVFRGCSKLTRDNKLTVQPTVLLNSLLATLNARESLRETDPGDLVPIHLSNMDLSRQPNQSATAGPEHPRLGFHTVRPRCTYVSNVR